MTDTEYYDLIRPYDDAMKLLLTRLEILNHNIYKASAENPIHTMQYRIKSKQSIEEKLIREVIFFLYDADKLCDLVQQFFNSFKLIGEVHFRYSLFSQRTETFVL